MPDLKTYKILLLPGDGVGPEVLAQGERVLKFFQEKNLLACEMFSAMVGGAAYELAGHPLPPETLQRARESDAILLGAVGGPKWDDLESSLRPEAALLSLRKELGLFANLRPVRVFDTLVAASTLKTVVVRGVDILIVRELTGGIYYGMPRGITVENGERVGRNTTVYSESEIARVARVAFASARTRRKKLTSVDKANVLESNVLWREVVTRVHKSFSDVELTHMYVDNAAMQLIKNPRQFDVILTTNMYGDILSDEAAMLSGSLGMIPSASLNETGKGLFEPIHGSAPDLARQNKANPLATILSVALMFALGFRREDLSVLIEKAVATVLKSFRTADIMTPHARLVGTEEMGDLVVKALSCSTFPSPHEVGRGCPKGHWPKGG